MPPVKVLCSVCESGVLKRVDSEEVTGYLCENASDYEFGKQCHALVSIKQYKTMLEEQKTAQPPPAPQPPPPPPPSLPTIAEANEAVADTDTRDSNSDQSSPNDEGNESDSSDDAPLGGQSNSSDSSQVAPNDSSQTRKRKLGRLGGGRCKPPASKLEAEEDTQLSQTNTRLMLEGTLVVKRQPLMPQLMVSEKETRAARLKQPFKAPAILNPSALPLPVFQITGRKTLGVRRRHFGGSFSQAIPVMPAVPVIDIKQEAPVDVPPDYVPVVLWEPSQEEVEAAKAAGKELSRIEVEPFVGRFLRPHQREGVQFMADCVLEQCKFNGAGAILADDMGLGKTLQSITLLVTLLRQGFEKGVPVVRRGLIVCPTSLVSNWSNEIKKWTGDRVHHIALSESSKDKVIDGVKEYLDYRIPHCVLIISYETFRMHRARFKVPKACDLLICDEAHRLKNDETGTYQALHELDCKRRILLSGTPMQNNLQEFYAMVNFTNPGVVGDPRSFHKYYEMPILRGREPDATDKETEVGLERSAELSAIVNQFILRRTNALLSEHLPPKVVQVVCCKLTPLQETLYRHFMKSKAVKSLLRDENGKSGVQVLPLIMALKKLCNHPKLVYDAACKNALGFDGCQELFPPDFRRVGNDPGFSGKMDVLDKLLTTVRANTDDRVVLVSNYTETLDLFGALCRLRHWPFLRLDGTTSVKKRQKLVDQLLDRKQDNFVFLLSSKAGGCGLNLVGANRLVLFDPDWNPAVDKQAAARVWRDGQKKRCYIYRFLTTGSIEEKVYQRQLSKEGLTSVMGGAAKDSAVSMEDLRDLFSLLDKTMSDTHDTLECTCLGPKPPKEAPDDSTSDNSSEAPPPPPPPTVTLPPPDQPLRLQDGFPPEEELELWSHHQSALSVPDPCFRNSVRAEESHVSFIFGCEVQGKFISQEEEDTAMAVSCLSADTLETIQAAKAAGVPAKPKAVTSSGGYVRRKKPKFVAAPGPDEAEQKENGGAEAAEDGAPGDENQDTANQHQPAEAADDDPLGGGDQGAELELPEEEEEEEQPRKKRSKKQQSRPKKEPKARKPPAKRKGVAAEMDPAAAADLDGVDEATRNLILALQAEDALSPQTPPRNSRKKKKASTPVMSVEATPSPPRRPRSVLTPEKPATPERVPIVAAVEGHTPLSVPSSLSMMMTGSKLQLGAYEQPIEDFDEPLMCSGRSVPSAGSQVSAGSKGSAAAKSVRRAIVLDDDDDFA